MARYYHRDGGFVNWVYHRDCVLGGANCLEELVEVPAEMTEAWWCDSLNVSQRARKPSRTVSLC